MHPTYLSCLNVATWNRKVYIVPNKEFMTGRRLNWTRSNPVKRGVIAVGVAYGSDTQKARQLLLKVNHEHPLLIRAVFNICSTFQPYFDMKTIIV
jgi:small-conductance mechanosensitive channel